VDVFMQFLKDKFAIRLAAIDLGVSYKDFTAKIKVFFAFVYCLFSFVRLYGIDTTKGNVIQVQAK
jgi:hypothetical protein